MHSAAWEMARDKTDLITAEDFMVLNTALFPAYQPQPDYKPCAESGTPSRLMRLYRPPYACSSWPASALCYTLHYHLAFLAAKALKMDPVLRMLVEAADEEDTTGGAFAAGNWRCSRATPHIGGGGGGGGDSTEHNSLGFHNSRPCVLYHGGKKAVSYYYYLAEGSAAANKGEGKGAGIESSRKRKTAAADAGEDAVTPAKRSKGRKSMVKTEATINDKEMD
ncbi:hypothetical protein DL769_000161 [Monosporascus sp. CRB-8-3]|nr:hypothetical protein DL769_000161 [Monosporascus sp. CRB-8-3]